jgi:tetratricopeptide (TPR) repeat protein
MKGSFTVPAGVAWFGDYLVAADKQLRRAYVYSMTDFGRLAFGSARHYYNGEWEASTRLLEEALNLNANYDLAYSGIGKYHLLQGDYEKAMYYLELGQNRAYYSQAFNHYRNQWVKDNFIWFALLFVLITGAIVYTEIRYHKKGGVKNEAAA